MLLRSQPRNPAARLLTCTVRLQASASARRGDGGAVRSVLAAGDVPRRLSPPCTDAAGAECIVSCAPSSNGVMLKRLALPLAAGGVAASGGEPSLGSGLGLKMAPVNLEVARLRKVQADAPAPSPPSVLPAELHGLGEPPRAANPVAPASPTRKHELKQAR